VDGSSRSLESDRLRLILDLHRGLNAPSASGDTLSDALRDLKEALDADRVALIARDRAGHMDVRLQVPRPDEPHEASFSQTAIDRVVQGGEALLATDIDDGSELGGAESVQRFKIRSILAIPFGGETPQGVLYLDSRSERRRFSLEDLDFAAVAAFYLGAAWKRADEMVELSGELSRSNERLAVLESDLKRYQIVGRSKALLDAFDELKRFARAGLRVVLRGETGTGKEVFARAYAFESSRATKPFVPVNIPALSPTLIESELFGHVRGAFTEAVRDKPGRLELADSGVLFLDEIGEIEPALQAKLLRFLDSGESLRVGDTKPRHLDVLVVSATNRAIEKAGSNQTFRADLFARLGQVVRLPPLRERKEDIPLLVEHFLAARGEAQRRFSKAALDAMTRYPWPLNIRELRHVVERALALVDREVIEVDDLPVEVRLGEGLVPGEGADGALRSLKDVVQEAERGHFRLVLAHTKGQRRKAIAILGIAPETFYKRLAEYGLDSE
jgi:transcriptional regulator with GAF, ATPase, and Fis domain